MFENCLFVKDAETDINRERLLVPVFHFRLGQCGAAIGTPVNRLVTFVDMAIGKDPAKGSNDVGLEVVILRQVGIVPVPQDAKTHEVLALVLHLLCGIGTTRLSELGRRNLLPRLADLLFDLQLDRQAVTVPARHVGRIKTFERAALDDNVLEHLVDRVTNMDFTVRIGWSIVEDERRTAGTGLANTAVEILFFPAMQHRRFALRQIALHREIRPGQVEGIFVVTHGHSSCLTPSRLRALSASARICRRRASKDSNFISSRIRPTNSTSTSCP